MKKGSREVVALIEEEGDHVINYNYDGKGGNLTIMDNIKKHANAEYDTEELTFEYFKEHLKGMKFVKQAQIKRIDWKEVWEYFKGE